VAVDRSAGSAALIWETRSPDVSRAAADLAARGLAEIAGNAPIRGPSFNEGLHDLLDRRRRRQLSGSTAVLKAAALRRGIPCEVASGQHLVLGHGARQQHLFSSLTGTTSLRAAKLSLDKRRCNRRLAGLSLPVPKQIRVEDAQSAADALALMGGPAVVKPLKGNQGRGITVGVRKPEDVQVAFDRAFSEKSGVLVEEWVQGTDCRLLVVGGRFVAAIASQPAEVVGDGRRTVRELVAELNAEEDRDDVRLSPVPVDAALERHLAGQGLDLDAVVDAGRVVSLAAHGHVATGGVPHDVTDLVHPENRRLAERAAIAVGLDVAGVDVVIPDIRHSYREVGGKILEVNTRPGLAMHAWPRSGRPRDVAGAILDLIYPSPDRAFVPALVVAGHRGTSEVGRQTAKLLRDGGVRVGLALKGGAFLDGQPIDIPRRRLNRGASVLLREPELEALVAATSLQRAWSHGLGLETCDGAAVLPDGKGTDAAGLEGIEILRQANRGAFVAAVTDRTVRDRLDDLAPDRLILVGEDPHDPEIREHLEAGGRAVLRHWTPTGPTMRLERSGEILAEAPLAGRTMARQRSIMASMFAFALARGYEDRHAVQVPRRITPDPA
jgi:cyanophycin synthetase